MPDDQPTDPPIPSDAPSEAGAPSAAAAPGPAQPSTADDEHAPVVVRTSTPEDLLALAAHTLGFWPSESLVMISLRGPRLRSGLVARVDLDACTAAAERALATGDPTALDHLVDQLLPAMVRDGARAVVVLLCAEVSGVSAAHAAVVESAGRVVARHGLELVDAALLGAGRRWSLTCSDGCCPAGGVAMDPRTSRVAAEGVLAGSAPARSRGELLDEHLAALAPATGDETTATTAAVAGLELSSSSAFGVAVATRGPADDAGPARAVLRLWWRLVGPAADEGPVPQESAELLVGLTDLLVRDALMVSVTPTGPRHLGLVDAPGEGAGEPGGTRAHLPRDRGALLEAVTAALADCSSAQHPGDDAVSERAAAVLTVIARTAPRHLRAAPLALLAYVHWWRASTLAAEAAAQAAVVADPGHGLGELVSALLARGVAPDWLPLHSGVRGPGAAPRAPRGERRARRQGGGAREARSPRDGRSGRRDRPAA